MTAHAQVSGLPKRTQSACCYNAANDRNATFCGECGKPIIRCMASEECGGLLDDRGFCPVCISPALLLAEGAILNARAGGEVSLPLLMGNRSVVGRPLFVTGLWTRQNLGEWHPQALGWERLDEGEIKPFSVRSGKLDSHGLHTLGIMMAVASRWRWREERFAFTTEVSLDVDAEDKTTGPVVNIGGESAGHGNAVYIAGQTNDRVKSERSSEAILLPLVRAEREERKFGLRGLSEALGLSASTRFHWVGFPKREVPIEGPIVTSDGILGAGRSRTRSEGGDGDIRLLAETPEGSIDDDLSRMISRRHCELYIESDRLMLRVNGGGGIRVNGDAFGRDKTVMLQDGDVIAPLTDHPAAFSIRVNFQSNHGQVEQVTMTRDPVSGRGG